MSEFDKAKADFTEALTYDAANKDIRTELEHLKKKMAQHKQQEKQMYSGLFEKMNNKKE